MPDSIISGSSRIVVSKEQTSCEMDEDVVVLNLKDGEYYELNPVAARVWSIIQEPTAMEDIMSIILDEYAVGKKELEQDLYDLVHELSAKKLVDIHN